MLRAAGPVLVGLALFSELGRVPVWAAVDQRDLLVSFSDQTSPQSASATLRASGLENIQQLRPLPVFRAQLDDPSADLTETFATLGANATVRSVELDQDQRVALIPNDPLFAPYQWNLRRIGMPDAWDLRPSAPTITVAVLDTGVDLQHPDLLPNLLVSQGRDFINGTSVAQDDESHGTAVAGIIGAVGNNNQGIAGIAWTVRILPIKALNADGRGPDSAMVQAITYAADAGAQIINISSTGGNYSAALEQAVNYAENKGDLVVAAAGNTGDTDNQTTYPAALPGVIAVGAIDNHDQVPASSQRGPYLALVAPGVEVPSTALASAGHGPYASYSGTSIAAPHVSGVAALLWSLRPDLAASDIARILQTSADPPPQPVTDNSYGAGILNASKAMALVRPGIPPGGATPALTAPVSPPASPALAPLAPTQEYFAEGSTNAPFDEYFAAQNAASAPATVHFTFLKTDGPPVTYDLHVDPKSRTTLHASDVLPNADFGAIVQADQPVFVERSMYFGHGATTVVGAPSPARSWVMAEGSIQPPFDTWILMANPNNAPATATLTFSGEDGSHSTYTQLIPPLSRRSVRASAVIPQPTGFWTSVTADQPIVVERSMYFPGGQAGSGALGTPAPAREWFEAAGSTTSGFDNWLLIANPNAAAATVTLSFMTDSGAVTQQTQSVRASSRSALYLNSLVPNSVFGVKVDADQPVVVEQSTYFAAGTAGATTPATAQPSPEWFFPEGGTTGSEVEQLAILNPQGVAATVRIEPWRQDGQPAPATQVTVAATTRATIDVNPIAPDAVIALHVVADHPVVVQRTTYFAQSNGQGATASAGYSR